MPRTTPPVSAGRHLLLCWHLGSVLATALSPLVIAVVQAQLAVGHGVVEGVVRGVVAPASSRSFAATILEEVRRVRRAANDSPTCEVWNSATPNDLCALGREDRFQLMRKVRLFQDKNISDKDNVFLSQLFLLDMVDYRGESDLYAAPNIAHLRYDSASSCLLADAGSENCTRCFNLIDDLVTSAHHYFVKFNRTLDRFDCLGTNSTDRRFSPNATCDSCRAWYRKWLLVNLSKHYSFELCKTWCDYAQLACPHLTATKAGDYAGHPSFQCTDTDFPLPVGKASTQECDCVHPCDLQTTLGEGDDYFATKLHCPSRKRRRTCPSKASLESVADRSSANAWTRCSGSWSLSRPIWLGVAAWWWTMIATTRRHN